MRHLSFFQQLRLLFLLMLLLGAGILAYNLYQEHQFDNNPLSSSIQNQISQKERHLQNMTKKIYGISPSFPMIVSDSLPSRLYGAAVKTTQGDIRIYLNKKRMKESLPYVLDDVMPHEYAHALMFYFGKYDSRDGHSKEWQTICLNLGGVRCDRYVNHNDILTGKVPFL